jgi:hypothetical protein
LVKVSDKVTLGTRDIEQDFPGEEVVPATRIDGVVAAGAEAAQVQAHGLLPLVGKNLGEVRTYILFFGYNDKSLK